jgi:predicted ATP-dependent endonuclease of OLD family
MANAISRVEIKDFLAFKGEFTADFCPGVNVIIGGNATGKTTLLKAMYLIMETENIRKRALLDDKSKSSVLKQYFQNICIKPCHISWGTNNVDKTERRAESYIHCVVDDLEIINDPNAVDGITEIRPGNQIFIPAKEILEHSKGLLALNNMREIPFDQTYIDILSNAELGATKEVSKINKVILDKIKEIIGGEVGYENDTFYIVKADNEKVPFSLEASGFKKFGLLWKLVHNGLLEPGSVLFWDEPENSLNPELIPTLVDILLELQKGGVQIFIATHSYDVARWFELNKKAENSLRYFNLRKTDTGIAADVADSYTDLPNSVIEDAGNKLYKRVVEVGAQNAGVTLK